MMMIKYEQLKKVRHELPEVAGCRGSIIKFTVASICIFSIALSNGFAAELQKENATDQNAPKVPVKQQVDVKSESSTSGKVENVAVSSKESAADKQIFIKKIKELQEQRRKISLEIYQLRVKLIKEEPSLQVLQRSTMDMHRRMAAEINRNDEMKNKLSNAKKIDTQIMELINENK